VVSLQEAPNALPGGELDKIITARSTAASSRTKDVGSDWKRAPVRPVDKAAVRSTVRITRRKVASWVAVVKTEVSMLYNDVIVSCPILEVGARESIITE